MNINPNHYDPVVVSDIVFGSQRSSDLINDILNMALPFPISGKNGLLLYGVPGTGKSALATMLPDAIERVKTGQPADKFFVSVKQGSNGATVINQVASRAERVPLSGSHSYFVLDEVDNLTEAAMLSLKSAMNMPGSVFILTTNYLNKIEVGVINRCHRVEFNAAPPEAWLPLFRRVLNDCGAVVSLDAALIPIIESCHGSARDIVTSAFQLASRQKRHLAQTSHQIPSSKGVTTATLGGVGQFP